MQKNTLLLFTVLLFSGCAERGYQLTTQANTRTVTAESSVDLKNTNIQTKTELHKMQEAVKKERRKQRKTEKPVETITEIKAREKKLRDRKLANAQLTKEKNELREEKKRKSVREKEEQQLRIARQKEKQRLAVEKKQEDVARKARLLEEQRVAEQQALRKKELQALKAKKNAAEAKILEAKIAQENMGLAAKKAMDLKQAQLRKAQAALEAKKLLDAQKALDLKRAATLRTAKIEEDKVREEERLAKAKRMKEQKARTEKLQTSKTIKPVLASTQPLKFNLINKIYHKFGSSEVHGHVIYLNKAGQETRLAQSKVYLLPVSAKLNDWYDNYYLKNKSNPSNNATVANYLNSTYLNLEKNFKFYGVAEGSYYVIIESKYPSTIAKNKKVYIAKRIQVGKYKKIMAVFSKKL